LRARSNSRPWPKPMSIAPRRQGAPGTRRSNAGADAVHPFRKTTDR